MGANTRHGRIEISGDLIHSRTGIGSSQGDSSFELKRFGVECGDGIETRGESHFRGFHDDHDDWIAGCRIVGCT
ncbi:MAG: hypothetical protein ISS17_01115 [Bacteroidales bacterium]|nr:hypothetical protein [Bacteroidales bacterium]